MHGHICIGGDVVWGRRVQSDITSIFFPGKFNIFLCLGLKIACFVIYDSMCVQDH